MKIYLYLWDIVKKINKKVYNIWKCVNGIFKKQLNYLIN